MSAFALLISPASITNPDYFKDPEMRKRYATRGVIHSWAEANGGQRIESTGALTKKRMETVDEEFTREALRFMEDAAKSDQPFFLWWNSTRMHIWTRLKAESQGKTGLGIYPDGVVEHDTMVGEVLAKSTRSASRTTPSSCTRPTTAPRSSRGPMAGNRRSAAKRTPTGRAVTACPA